MNMSSFSQFGDLIQGLNVTGQNTNVAHSFFVLTPIIGIITTLASILGVLMLFFLPALFLSELLLTYIPFLSQYAPDQKKGHIIMKMVMSIILASVLATGFWTTAVGWVVEGGTTLLQDISGSSLFSGNMSPQAMIDYPGLVGSYSDKQAAEEYAGLIQKETATAASMQTYYGNNHPTSTDQTWLSKKRSYTIIVCKLGILSAKLEKDNYAGLSGRNNSIYKTYLQTTGASDNAQAPFNSMFLDQNTIAQFEASGGTINTTPNAANTGNGLSGNGSNQAPAGLSK